MSRELHDDIPPRMLRDLRRAPHVDESELDPWLRTSGYTLSTAERSRQDREPIALDEALHPRERQVLEAISHGLSEAMVGEMLHLAPETVKGYAKRARYRLRAKTTAHAACIALRRGLIN